MNRSNITKHMLDYQKQVLEFQKSAFENGYNAIVALQERQLELADRMIGQIPNMPDEARDLMRTWRGTAEEGQRQFKNTVDGSFAAATAYLDRLAEGAPADTSEATPQGAKREPSSNPAGETEAAD